MNQLVQISLSSVLYVLGLYNVLCLRFNQILENSECGEVRTSKTLALVRRIAKELIENERPTGFRIKIVCAPLELKYFSFYHSMLKPSHGTLLDNRVFGQLITDFR